MLKDLPADRIEKLASKPDVKRIACENFLGTLDGCTKSEALANLNLDAKLYGWNAATVSAIEEGIWDADRLSLGWNACLEAPKPKKRV